MTGITSGSLSDLVHALSTGELTATEVVSAHLDRIADLNPRLNAQTPLDPEAALAAAKQLDEQAKDGRGALGGVPFTVKENIDVAGSPTTWGLPALAGAIAAADAPAVDRLRRAGGIPIARGNLPDFALRWHTDSSLRGATVNPWSPDVSPGGSSGGDAVAVATGMTPLGLGSDYGGSIRVPASACGVVGLKPTVGRIPHANAQTTGVPNLGQQLMAVPGVLVRTVADAALAYGLLAGPDPRDPYAAPATTEPDAQPRLRIGVTTAPAGVECHPDVKQAIERAATALERYGHQVEHSEPPIEPAAESWLAQTITEVATGLLPLMRQAGGAAANQIVDAMIEQRPPLDLAAYQALFPARLLLARTWSGWFTEHDVLLGPVSGQPTRPPGFDLEPAQLDQMRAELQLTIAVSAMGLPAVSLPAGLGTNGAPLAVQLVGARFREADCLAAAAVLEREAGQLTPPLV